jgi:hypothetical protein
MINEDLNYDVRRTAEIALIKIREKEVSRVQKSFVTKENISNYISSMIRTRTQNNLMPEYSLMFV